MDTVIEKLSNLESIWKITSKEIVDLIINDEIDIFKYKFTETLVI